MLLPDYSGKIRLVDVFRFEAYPYGIMHDERLNKYKIELEKERGLLLVEIKNDGQPVDFGSDVDHGEEKTDQTEELSNHLAAAQDLKNRLSEIDVALSKIHSGKYGVCEQCGGTIEEEVLNIAPESRFCKKCKL
jgi:RNA polymerase-binding transcription factor DksA